MTKMKKSGMVNEIADAISTITSEDKSHDYTIQELAVEMNRRRLIPGQIYEKAIWTAIKEHVRKAAKTCKKNVGTESNPVMVRRFGCYFIFHQSESGKEVGTPCWKEWEMMNKNQMRSALEFLFRQAASMKREAKTALNYCNKLLVNRGAAEIDASEL